MKGRLTLIVILSFAGVAKAQTVCRREALDQFIVRAQAADTASLPAGRTLINCKDLSAEAVQWTAFLLAYSGDRAQSLQLDEPAAVLPSRSGRARDQILSRARAGDYRELWARVDANETRFGADPEALLVLGRAMARKALFARSRIMYVSYLRLKPADWSAEAEFLYTFLWEKDNAAAKLRFESAARRPLPLPLLGPVERGLALIRGGRSPTTVKSAQPATPALSSPAPAPAPVNPPPRPAISSAVNGVLSSRHVRHVYQRDTVGASYDGVLHAQVMSHRVKSPSFTDETSSGTEVALGVTETLKNVDLFGFGGYFSSAGGAYFGSTGLTVRYKDWRTGVSAARRPLLLERPLTLDDAALMQDVVSFSLGYTPYVDLVSSLRKDGNFSAYERHEVTARIPLRRTPVEDWLAVRIPVMVEIRPRPNPNYDTVARVETAGVGVEWAKRLHARFSLGLNADYELARSTDRVGKSSETPFGDVEVLGTLDLSSKIRLTLSALYVWADENALLQEQALGSALILGLRHELP